METNEVIIKDEFITLSQFLKYCNIISYGGEAKSYLDNKLVYVNDEVEKRRGRKLRKDDKIVIDGVSYKICSSKK